MMCVWSSWCRFSKFFKFSSSVSGKGDKRGRGESLFIRFAIFGQECLKTYWAAATQLKTKTKNQTHAALLCSISDSVLRNEVFMQSARN